MGINNLYFMIFTKILALYITGYEIRLLGNTKMKELVKLGIAKNTIFFLNINI